MIYELKIGEVYSVAGAGNVCTCQINIPWFWGDPSVNPSNSDPACLDTCIESLARQTYAIRGTVLTSTALFIGGITCYLIKGCPEAVAKAMDKVGEALNGYPKIIG